jgi:4-hydroxy-3-methylbut-2-en-1-yl diphosphate reductase
MKVIVAAPRGFCAGVDMAIETLNRSLRLFGPPVYVYHEIVHNKHVVADFRERGAIFVDNVEDVPKGSTLVFSAHGVSPQVRQAARDRSLQVIDATCPLVTKVHTEAIRFARQGHTIFLVGHEGHDETEGTMGEAPDNIRLVSSPESIGELDAPAGTIAYLTQTTLSVDDATAAIERLRDRFPAIIGPPSADICYATQNRQEAVRELASEADVVVVLGSQNSSNSQRLAEVAREAASRVHLIDDASELRTETFDGASTLLVTAGASAPESVVRETLDWLVAHFGAEIEERTLKLEDQSFQLPVELRRLSAAAAAGG